VSTGKAQSIKYGAFVVVSVVVPTVVSKKSIVVSSVLLVVSKVVVNNSVVASVVAKVVSNTSVVVSPPSSPRARIKLLKNVALESEIVVATDFLTKLRRFSGCMGIGMKNFVVSIDMVRGGAVNLFS